MDGYYVAPLSKTPRKGLEAAAGLPGLVLVEAPSAACFTQRVAGARYVATGEPTPPAPDEHAGSKRGEPVLKAAGLESSASAGGDDQTGVGFRFALGFVAAVVLALILSLALLDRSGVAARVVPAEKPSIVVVNDAKGLLAAWDGAGVHGAQLVDVTRDLGYAFPPEGIPGSAGWPVPMRDLQSVFRTTVERRSTIWVASKTGIARSVTYVVDPASLAEKVRVGRERGYPGIAPDGRSITADDDGYLRQVGDGFPSELTGPAVLNIDASYFVNGTPEGLLGMLEQSKLNYRFVTLNRAVDATDVPDAARLRLDSAAEMLRRRDFK
jgi:hypothetical protein